MPSTVNPTSHFRFSDTERASGKDDFENGWALTSHGLRMHLSICSDDIPRDRFISKSGLALRDDSREFTLSL
jgi:hypothetical protein